MRAMSDVVERLRVRSRENKAALKRATHPLWARFHEIEIAASDAAAAEIARLRAENATLRAELAMAREREGMTGLEYRGG